jgi:WhiB family redox-sensing transcriptional regulator
MDQGRRRAENWRAVGSCRDSDPNLFYPLGRGHPSLEQTEVAKSICRACPSREPCLAFALATRQDLGVWGGTSPEERRELIRARRRAIASKEEASPRASLESPHRRILR